MLSGVMLRRGVPDMPGLLPGVPGAVEPLYELPHLPRQFVRGVPG